MEARVLPNISTYLPLGAKLDRHALLCEPPQARLKSLKRAPQRADYDERLILGEREPVLQVNRQLLALRKASLG
jgi:hypothetical protein